MAAPACPPSDRGPFRGGGGPSQQQPGHGQGQGGRFAGSQGPRTRKGSGISVGNGRRARGARATGTRRTGSPGPREPGPGEPGSREPGPRPGPATHRLPPWVPPARPHPRPRRRAARSGSTGCTRWPRRSPIRPAASATDADREAADLTPSAAPWPCRPAGGARPARSPARPGHRPPGAALLADPLATPSLPGLNGPAR